MKIAGAKRADGTRLSSSRSGALSFSIRACISAILRCIGGIWWTRSEASAAAFDLSQDYDFALRATERARRVCHVPGILYHWREHPGSGSAGGKPEARKTNLAALADAMERRGLAAEIIEYPTANRVRLKILEWPKVSIIIPTDSAERSRACIEQLPRMTSYPNYEIVIVTNSALADLLEAAAPKEPAFRFVRYDKPFNFSDKCNARRAGRDRRAPDFFQRRRGERSARLDSELDRAAGKSGGGRGCAQVALRVPEKFSTPVWSLACAGWSAPRAMNGRAIRSITRISPNQCAMCRPCPPLAWPSAGKISFASANSMR